MKRLFFFFSIIQSFLFVGLHSHGFGENTWVRTTEHSWWPIEQVCRNPHDIEQWVLSHKPHTDYCTAKRVKSGARSTTDCYIRIHFDKSSNHDILCTPIQEFYVPATDTWVPAYQLKTGDRLLSDCKKLKAIVAIEFIKKPLKVYSIEVEDEHNFLVGHYNILTHNMVIPINFLLEFSIAFGEGASAGAGAGSYFGPVTVAGGVFVGGLIGIAVKGLWDRHRVRDYELMYDKYGFDYYFHNYANQRTTPDDSDGSGGDNNNNNHNQGPEDPDPNDPKKKSDNKGPSPEDAANLMGFAKKRSQEQEVVVSSSFKGQNNNQPTSGSQNRLQFNLDNKIQKQMGKRGWKDNTINEAINNPNKIVKTRDNRNLSTGQKMDEPASAYYHKDGGYVVRNDQTGSIVQVSDRNDPNWIVPWD